jgi:hypothetical protein
LKKKKKLLDGRGEEKGKKKWKLRKRFYARKKYALEFGDAAFSHNKESSILSLNSMLLVSDAILLVTCFADIFQHCNHLHLSTTSEKVRA